MAYPKFIASNKKEESISVQRVIKEEQHLKMSFTANILWQLWELRKEIIEITT